MKNFTCFMLLACTLALLGVSPTHAADWPQWLGSNADSVWRETGILEKFPKGGPKVVWRIPMGKGYTGPAVAGGRVYVMDRQNPPGAKKDSGKPDFKKGTPVIERLLCLDASNGKQLWEQKWDTHYRISYGTGPRTTPLVRDGKVYALGAMGDFLCVDANTGKKIWHIDFLKRYQTKPPIWGYSASPVLIGETLYCLVGGKDHAIVAFNKNNGKELWHALTSEEVCYAPPILIDAGGKKQLIVWLSDSISGLHPKTGQVYWTYPYPENGNPQRPAVSISTPRFSDNRLYISSFYHGSMMLEFTKNNIKPKVAWRSKTKRLTQPDKLHLIMCTPLMKNGFVYGVDGMGYLRCLEAATGKERWSTFQPTGMKSAFLATAFLVEQGKRCFLFNDEGKLIIGRLSPKGYKELDRTKLIAPSQKAKGRTVVWCHPAFANRCIYVRNDKEMLCVSLAAPPANERTHRLVPGGRSSKQVK